MTNIFARANGAQPGNKRIAKTLNLRTARNAAIAAVHLFRDETGLVGRA
jgi:hypothetical protein